MTSIQDLECSTLEIFLLKSGLKGKRFKKTKTSETFCLNFTRNDFNSRFGISYFGDLYPYKRS